MVAALIAAGVLAGCASAPAQPTQTQAQTQAKYVNITAEDLYKRVKAGEKPLIVDVRTQEEWQAGHIDIAKLIPLQSLPDGAKALDKNQEIVLICRSGNRSAQAAELLAAAGFTKLVNVTGGMQSWEKLGAPMVK